MPIKLPFSLIRAPPELPGLMAASVWIKFSYSLIPTFDLPLALTIPYVTVWIKPNGLPTAITSSPSLAPSVSISK